MNRTFLIFALLILIAVVSGVLWFGVRAAKDEERLFRGEYEALLKTRVQEVRDAAQTVVVRYESRFMPILLSLPVDAQEIRELQRREPFAEQYFRIDSEGRLKFPDTALPDLSENEQEFLVRTKNIISGKRLLHLSVAEGSSKFSRQDVGAWYPYYWNDGLHLLFVVEHGHEVRGVEVNATRMTADLIEVLAADLKERPFKARVEVSDVLKRTIFQTETSQPTQGIKVEGSMPAPFGAWNIVATGAIDAKIGRSAQFNILAGTLFVALMIGFLGGYYIYLNRRAYRDAMNQVNFVNQVSHELKTPLTNLRLYAELLETEVEGISDKANHHISVIVSECERLARIIGNILTFSGRDQKKFKLRPKNVALRKIILDTVEPFMPALKERDFKIELQVDDANVTVDPDYIQQIVSNLISNVEKYGSSGKYLAIDARVKQQEVVITVRDRGPGIQRSEKARIFDPFYRVSNKLTDGVSGAGIGLTIVRELARGHGGDVMVMESPEGAVFEVRLKLQRTGDVA